MEKIVMATKNKGKIEELKKMLKDYDILSQSELKIKDFDVEENGQTFEKNAIIKAKAIKNVLKENMYIIAEDSGICIDCLSGYPGVKTKRAASEELKKEISDYERNEIYIQKVGNNTNRKVVWQTVIALIELDGNIKTFMGEVEGEIAKKQIGDNGFGFDAIFYIPQKGMTLAQMDYSQKEEFSARKRAVEKLVKYLEQKCK